RRRRIDSLAAPGQPYVALDPSAGGDVPLSTLRWATHAVGGRRGTVCRDTRLRRFISRPEATMPKQPRNHEPTIGIFDLRGRTDTDEAQTTPLRGHPDLTLRDEANAITARLFRNGFLEDLHAGQWSPVLSGPGGSRITDAEMKKLMIETSARLAHWLYL